MFCADCDASLVKGLTPRTLTQYKAKLIHSTNSSFKVDLTRLNWVSIGWHSLYVTLRELSCTLSGDWLWISTADLSIDSRAQRSLGKWSTLAPCLRCDSDLLLWSLSLSGPGLLRWELMAVFSQAEWNLYWGCWNVACHSLSPVITDVLTSSVSLPLPLPVSR